MCVCLFGFMHEREAPAEARGGHCFPGAGVSGGCERPDAGARNETPGLCKNSTCS